MALFLFMRQTYLSVGMGVPEMDNLQWMINYTLIRKSNSEIYNRKSILVKDRPYPIYGTGTTGNYGKVR